MNKRHFIIWFLLLAYIILAIAWTLHYAENFSNYGNNDNYKGDELIRYIKSLVLSSTVLHSFFLRINGSIKLKMMLLGTLANLIVSIISGFAIMLIFSIDGIPKQLIYLFGGCYLSIFTLLIIGTNTESKAT